MIILVLIFNRVKEPNRDLRRQIICEYVVRYFEREAGVEFDEEEALLLRGARRKRKKVCLRLPAED